MDRNFGVGDVVRLVTGGPNMVVVEIIKNGELHLFRCRWFEHGVMNVQTLPFLALEHAPNEDEDLESGSVVRLKSGGPEMTVMTIYGPHFGDTAKCVWFDREGRTQDEAFLRSSLVFVS